MTPFLQQVARHYFPADGTAFIFPSRRAVAFFRSYFGLEVKASGLPALSPPMLTESDFAYKVSGFRPTDRVSLMLELYDCYKTLNPKAEPLDDFIFWGDVLLSDFDDTDKYLADARHLFANVSDIKALRDSFSYLSETQQKAVEQFARHFETGGRIKDKFLSVWEILLPLYENFNARLREKGLSYEGMVYRSIAERLDSEAAVDILAAVFPGVRKFVFVGLNAPNECEKKLMRKMENAGLAEFCWDFSSDFIRDSRNKSSFFLSNNVSDFPQAFKLDEEGLGTPGINILSVPSSVGQAKQIPQILHEISASSPGMETAIVLPDSSLLMPVLNSIPEDVPRFNVTMGYPMLGSQIWNLIDTTGALQLHVRNKGGKPYFYHRQVLAIFSNSVFKTVLSEQGRSAVGNIKASRNFYVDAEDFRTSGDPVLEAVFAPASEGGMETLLKYHRNIIETIAPLLSDKEDMTLELDFAKAIHETVLSLQGHHMSLQSATYFKFLSQLLSRSTVPFIGEPLCGLQIMGPLETRALDFRNLIILSCNEGVYPHRSVSSSFIPPELRKGFGLPTYEYQDALNAYYFYRLIQRASTVWMLFDSRTEGLKSCEESRYIKQLELHFGVQTSRYVVKAPISAPGNAESIAKTEAHVAALRGKTFSPSSLQNYLACPAKFYYHSVRDLKAEGEVSESLDAGMLGNVFHNTMEEIYKPYVGKMVSAAALDALIAGTERIRKMVSDFIMREMKSFEVTGRNIIFEEVVCRYVGKALQRDRELLAKYGAPAFKVIALEQWGGAKIGDYSFGGRLDRVDSFQPGEVRIVDYKTGKVTDEDFIINEDNAEAVVDALFGPDNSKRPKIALQLFLYDKFISSDSNFLGMRIVNSIYQTGRLFTSEAPSVALDRRFCELCEGRLLRMMDEIMDTSVPWSHTADVKVCEWCDFKNICGR